MSEDELTRITNEVAALTPEQIQEELLKLRTRQRLQQHIPEEVTPLKPEELTREDLYILAKAEYDDPWFLKDYVLETLREGGTCGFDLEDQREWYSSLDEDEQKEYTAYILNNREVK